MGDLTVEGEGLGKKTSSPIIVSGCGTLCVPKLSEGTGKAMSDALMDAICD